MQNPFSTHYVARRRRNRLVASREPSSRRIEIRFSHALETDMAKLRNSGFACIGTSDVVSPASAPGPTDQLKEQAESVGAEVVLFCIWPAKLRSVKRLDGGEIDLDTVVSDPPRSFSPRSYAVTSAVFFVRTVHSEKALKELERAATSNKPVQRTLDQSVRSLPQAHGRVKRR